jgi:hypothetical protein
MSTPRTSMLLFGLATATLVLYLAFGASASADDCASRIVDIGGLLQLPSAVAEDCMRTGWMQAALTALMGLFGGTALARQVMKRSPRRKRELPAVSKNKLIEVVKDNEKKAKELEESWKKKKIKKEEDDDRKPYHMGVSEKIGKALQEVQAEIDKLKSLEEQNTQKAKEEAEKMRVRLSALLWALSKTLESNDGYDLESQSPQLPGSVGRFPAGKETDPKPPYKCNKFVVDAYAYGAGIGLATKDGQLGFPSKNGIDPPMAADLAGSGPLRNLTMAQVYQQPSTRPGDIVSFAPKPHHHGHTTIYLGNGLVVSAKPDDGATIELLDAESQDDDHVATRVRKYTASGK